MLVDRIALLERQLESAERRVRNAEDGARDAKSALAAALLTQARHQKSELASANSRANGAAQRPTQAEASDDAAHFLRQEYEQRFRASRESLAQEFQERLTNAKAAWEADAARQRQHLPGNGSYRLPARHLPLLANATASRRPLRKPAAVAPISFRDRFKNPAHKAALLMLAVAAGAGTILGWSTTIDKRAPSEPPGAATAPLPAEIAMPAPATPAPMPEAEPALPPAADMRATETVPDGADKARAADAAPGPAGPTEALHAPAPAPIEQPPAAPDANTAALKEELDALRERLDATTKRARLAEETLRAERRKTAAAPSRRTPAGDIKESEPASPLVAAPTQVPEPDSNTGSTPDRSLETRRFQTAE